MASYHGRLAHRARAAALGLWLATAGVALATAPAMAAEKEKQESLSADVGAKWKLAKAALDKDDFAGGIAAANEGLAVAKKPYDTEQMLMLLRYAYGKQKDYTNYADILEKLNELPILPEAERVASYKTLAQINAQNKNYDKAIPYAMKWADNGGGAEANTLLWQLYLIQHDCQNGIVYLEKAVAGRDATEVELRQENACYFTLGDKAKRQAVMEQLVKRFMKHDYLYDLLLIYDEQKIDMRAKLSVLRLEFQKDWLTRESEFTELAEDAIDIGSPTEALAVLNRGIERQAVKLIAPTDHPSRMLATAKMQAAEDKKQIATLDREAQAGKNGEADVKVGLVYLGQGENQKAVDAITRGLSPERVGRVKRVDDANMMLGIAYSRLGKADDAKKAFAAAQADPRMANAATIWIESL